MTITEEDKAELTRLASDIRNKKAFFDIREKKWLGFPSFMSALDARESLGLTYKHAEIIDLTPYWNYPGGKYRG